MSSANGVSGFHHYYHSHYCHSNFTFCFVIFPLMSDIKEEKKEVAVEVKEVKVVQDYRLTKKSVWGMVFVGLASIFGT